MKPPKAKDGWNLLLVAIVAPVPVTLLFINASHAFMFQIFCIATCLKITLPSNEEGEEGHLIVSNAARLTELAAMVWFPKNFTEIVGKCKLFFRASVM